MRQSQDKILERYDQTYKGFKKRESRSDVDPKGTLRRVLSFAPIVISKGDVTSVGIVPVAKLPSYWKMQEEGTTPSTWMQTYHIVGIRKEPSHRGDYWVLKSFKKGQAPSHLGGVELTISHPGIKERKFIQTGEEFLIKNGFSKIREWFGRNWTNALRSSKVGS